MHAEKFFLSPLSATDVPTIIRSTQCFVKYNIQLCMHHINQTFKIISLSWLDFSILILSYLVSLIYKFGLKVAPSPDSQTWQENKERNM